MTSVFIVFTSFLSLHPAKCAEHGPLKPTSATVWRKKASVLQSLSSVMDGPSKTKASTLHGTSCREYSAVPLRLLLGAAAHKRTFMRCPVTWAKRPCITKRRGQRLCSHRLLAGENALLLTTAFASDGRLSGRGCCKESCPVHRICRMIVRILVRNSQIVNIFGTSSEDALIQESVLQ